MFRRCSASSHPIGAPGCKLRTPLPLPRWLFQPQSQWLCLTATGLTGCTAGSAQAAFWGFASVALVCVAGLAYALGAVLARQKAEVDSRRLRSLLPDGETAVNQQVPKPGAGTLSKHGTATDDSVPLPFPAAAMLSLAGGLHWWQTDVSHRLLHWQGPTPPAGSPGTAECPLFAAGPQAQPLLEMLQREQAFGPLRLRFKPSFDGHASWEIQGQAQRDAAGRFLGFVGSAKGCDGEDGLRSAAALLMPALRANPAPALVLWRQDEDWQLAELNPAAQALWPTLKAGDKVQSAGAEQPANLLTRMPAGQPAAQPAPSADSTEPAAGWPLSARTLTALEGLQAGQTPPTVDGWCLAITPAVTPGARGAVLVRTGELLSPHQEADSFSFTLSHDLRAPIRVVEGFTRIVKEDYGSLLDRVGNDHLDRVLGAAARMNLMIDALLTLARLSTQPLARQPVNLSQLARYVAEDLRRSAPEREAEFDIQDNLSSTGDPTLMRLVLENLIGNAWKYSARSEHARISFGTVQQPGNTVAQGKGNGETYVVRDNGAGFDMRYADRLFGLFQRLHSASDFAGHGVGLASVQRIVRRHGGQIWAEAEPGKGAAFFFTLDRCAEP